MSSLEPETSSGETAPTVFPGYPPADGAPHLEPSRPRRRLLLVVSALVVVLALGTAGVAVVVSTGEGSPTSAPSTAPPPPGIALTATAVSPIEIRLDWTATGTDIEEFVIYRNGEALFTAQVPISTYTDRTAQPEQGYEYAIRAVGLGEEVESQAISVITPPPPPLAEARLEGSWVVRTTYVGGNAPDREIGERGREQWVFFPRCDEGACKVRIEAYYEGQQRTILIRKGRSYAGEGFARHHRCVKTPLDTTIEISLKVTKGSYFLGVWRASSFTGSYHAMSPAALGCPSGEVRRSLKGTFQP